MSVDKSTSPPTPTLMLRSGSVIHDKNLISPNLFITKFKYDVSSEDCKVPPSSDNTDKNLMKHQSSLKTINKNINSKQEITANTTATPLVNNEQNFSQVLKYTRKINEARDGISNTNPETRSQNKLLYWRRKV